MGSYLTIVNNTQDTYSIEVGCDKAALAIGGIVAGVITTCITAGALGGVILAGSTIIIAGTAISVSSGVAVISCKLHDELSKRGYITLKPGERYQFGKMALNLWQQCECIRSRQSGNDIITERVTMRPIFSGPLDGSNNDHDIQWWINKWGGHEEISRLTFK